MSIKNMLSNSFETSDDGKVVSLTTHYYQEAYENTKYNLVNIFKSLNYNIENINDQYGEILVTFKKGEIICTLYSESYNVTGVDFKIMTTYFIPFGRTVKILNSIYESLNKKLSLKAIGGKNIE